MCRKASPPAPPRVWGACGDPPACACGDVAAQRRLQGAYGALVLLRLACTLLPGYIHPDEHMQSTEVAAGDILRVQHYRAWEFDPVAPTRSCTAPHLLAGGALLALRWAAHTTGLDLVTPQAVVAAPRMALAVASLLLDSAAARAARGLPPPPGARWGSGLRPPRGEGVGGQDGARLRMARPRHTGPPVLQCAGSPHSLRPPPPSLILRQGPTAPRRRRACRRGGGGHCAGPLPPLHLRSLCCAPRPLRRPRARGAPAAWRAQRFHLGGPGGCGRGVLHGGRCACRR
mmetsp:Transcript_8697/g.28670  ORF Transcript_8697/g.28670 Transcript_8697/m.28670 type:complete len:287 (+) Transcript_8697:132-992(+)